MKRLITRHLAAPLWALALVLTANAAALEAAPPETAGMSPERLQRLSRELQEYVDAGSLSGAVVLVSRHGKIVVHEAFGYRDVEPGSVGEFGWGGAYHTGYWVDPVEDLVVVYMTQLIPAGDVDDAEKVRALVYQAIVD